jgi:uncharacterized surface protein with fasciclin (FAS1) repeats
MKKSYVLATLVCLAAACGGSEPAVQNAEPTPSASAADMPAEPTPAPSASAPAPEAKPVETAKPADKPPATPDILETAKAAGNFNTLLEAINTAGLADTLKGPGPFTVFAPTDDAFKKVPKAQLDKLLKDKDKLAKVLKFHVISGKLMAADVIKLKENDTVAGVKVKFSSKGADVMIDKAKITKTDIAAGNGVIHVIDTVIMPK